MIISSLNIILQYMISIRRKEAELGYTKEIDAVCIWQKDRLLLSSSSFRRVQVFLSVVELKLDSGTIVRGGERVEWRVSNYGIKDSIQVECRVKEYQIRSLESSQDSNPPFCWPIGRVRSREHREAQQE